MKNRFEVSTEGMRELQAGREPWQLAKELVSNSWDEQATVCSVTLRSESAREAYLSVYDDGPGFGDISDAWTLMKHTDKRLNPGVRGRFNIGEKEILSIAKQARITTSGKIVFFPPTGGRSVRTSAKSTKGTLIEVVLPWGTRQVRDTVDRLRELLPPPGIEYKVNDVVVTRPVPYKVEQATLNTVLQEKIGEPITTARRATSAEIYKGTGKGVLYEMGIPVQKIDCPYSVNVLQKIPLPPNRDTVKDSYLQDIYTLVLNATADEVEDVAASWVRTAIEDKDVSLEAVKTIARKRYGDKAVLWSTDTRSNDKALEAGYEVVHGRTLSAREREVFAAGAGMKRSSEVFPCGNRPMAYLPDEKLTEGMKQVRQYAKQLYKALYSRDLDVGFYSEFGHRTAADFGMGRLNFNIAQLGKAWFEEINERVTSLVLHEFAHTKGIGHEPSYYQSLEELAGRAVHLALERPEVFKVTDKGGNQ